MASHAEGEGNARQVNVLMVEDDPLFAELISTRVAEASPDKIEISARTSIGEGLEELERQRPDVILLDLNLPDARDLDGLEAIVTAAPDVPVVVLTGSLTEDRALKALRAGAEDYLVKPEADGGAVARALRYAIERHGMRTRLQRGVERAGSSGAAEPQGRLLDSRRQDVLELADSYRSALLTAAAGDDGARADLREVASGLYALGAGPRDVTDLHLAAIDQIEADGSAADRRGAALMAEGQAMLVELMGRLLDLYRRQAA